MVGSEARELLQWTPKRMGKEREAFLQRSVGSEAFDTGSKSRMLFPCSSVNKQTKRRGETKMSFITCSVLVRLFEWKRRNVRYSLCNF